MYLPISKLVPDNGADILGVLCCCIPGGHKEKGSARNITTRRDIRVGKETKTRLGCTLSQEE